MRTTFATVWIVASLGLPAAVETTPRVSDELAVMRIWLAELAAASADAPSIRHPVTGAQPVNPPLADHLAYGQLQTELLRQLAAPATRSELMDFLATHRPRYLERAPTAAFLLTSGGDAGRDRLERQAARLRPLAARPTALTEAVRQCDPSVIACREVRLGADRFDRDDVDGQAVLEYSRCEWNDRIGGPFALPSGRFALLIAPVLPPAALPAWPELEPRLRADFARTRFRTELSRRLGQRAAGSTPNRSLPQP